MSKRAFRFALTMVMLVGLLGGSIAFAQQIADIQKAIQRAGAGWVAGETSMTRLSPAERMKRVGLVLPKVTGKEKLLTPVTMALPPYLDWRDNGGNYVTPVRNQGTCASCWAFATAAALESVTMISNRTPGVDLDLSEQVLLSCSGTGNCELGGSIDSASDYIRSTGLPLESCYPYAATNGNCANACANWQASAYKITSWSWVATTSPTLEGIKYALFIKGPLVSTMVVFDDFYAYTGGIYRNTMGVGGANHAVLIVGYDDIDQCFIVKNSWGEGWGESGFFRIAYSEMNTLVGFGRYTIGYRGSVPACSYFVTQSFGSEGGTGSLRVIALPGCPWDATSNVYWIALTATTSEMGGGFVNFTVSPNPAGSPERSGYMTIAGQIYSVSQEAGPPCDYSISPTSQSFAGHADSGVVNVTATAGCDWSAVSNANWITITSGSTGTGNGAVYYSVGMNPSTSPRTGTLTIAGLTHTVNQAGGTCNYSISPTSQSFGPPGGTGSVNVTAADGCSWTAVSNTNWITVTNGSSGSGNGTVNYTVDSNSYLPRMGTLTIAGLTFTVNQETITCSYSISPTSQSFGASGGTGTVSITATSGCGWTARSNASWITVTGGGSGSGDGTVNYSVASNGSTSARTGTVTIARLTFTVDQDGITCSYSISPTSQSFGASGGTGSVGVTVATGCSWTAVSNDSWITVTGGSSGSGNGAVNYSVASNSSTSGRTGTLTVGGNTFSVTQSGASGPPDIAASPMTLDFGLVSKYRPATKPVTISNTGTGPLTISSITFEGVNAVYYRQTNNCSTVAPGASCTVNVTFAPTIVNIQVNAYMVISSNDPDENPVKVLCKGKGVNY